jgi:hypothetical protein
MSHPTRPKDTGQEVHNQGGLKDNYISNLINMASRDRVSVKYNNNGPNLLCKPYPLAYKRRDRGDFNPTNHNTIDTHRT